MKSLRVMARSALLASLLAGCGLLPGGADDKSVDWSGLADRIVAVAGSDRVTAMQMTASGQLSMTVRANGEDISWSATDSSEEVSREGDELRGGTASQPVGVAEIDWAAIESALPHGCQFGTVMVEWLPYGHVYQHTYCEYGDDNLHPTIDGKPVPSVIEGHDEAAIRAAIEAMEQVFPEGEILEFTVPIGTKLAWYSMTGPQIETASGEPGWYWVQYGNLHEGPSFGVTRAQDAFLSTAPSRGGLPPEMTFRASDTPAAAYAQALQEGLAHQPEAEGFAVSAASAGELRAVTWGVLTGGAHESMIPRG